MADLDEINEELDRVLILFFETLASLYTEQEDLGIHIQDGFLQMSRARYNMGAKSVGVLQYDDSRMKASAKVDLVSSSEENSEDNIFILTKASKSQKISEEPQGETTGSSGLRKRNVGSDKIENIGVNKTENESDMQKKSNSIPDPLKWFGVLVPQSLRQSQTNFTKALENVIHIANLKHKMTKLKGQYTNLLCQKMKLMEMPKT